MRILAVDDDPVVLDLLKACLKDCGHDHVVLVETAEDALQQIERAPRPFDCFLLDIMLPGIDGVDLCARIRDLPEYAAAPIIMITASREPNIMGRAFNAGATDFVSKPFDGLELGTRVNLAGLLSDSLHREKKARHEMADLSALVSITFDEAFRTKKAPFAVDYDMLKSTILKKSSGIFAMQLMSVEIEAAYGVFNTTTPAQFRQIIETISGDLSSLLSLDNSQFAYVGKGRFMVVTYGRCRIDVAQFRKQLEQMFRKDWDAARSGQQVAPAIKVQLISDRKLTTGPAAAATMDAFLQGEHSAKPVTQLTAIYLD